MFSISILKSNMEKLKESVVLFCLFFIGAIGIFGLSLVLEAVSR